MTGQSIEIILGKAPAFEPRASCASYPLWWNIQGRCYPMEGWWDNPGVILLWWSNALLGLYGGKSAALDFMEGPYRLRLQKTHEGIEVSGEGWSEVVVVSWRTLADEVGAKARLFAPFFEAHPDLQGIGMHLRVSADRLEGLPDLFPEQEA